MTARLKIEVVCADPDKQVLRSLSVPAGTSVADALAQSGIAQEFPGIDLAAAAVGIWGKAVPRDHVVSGGERIEVYRPLRQDPRAARRLKVGR